MKESISTRTKGITGNTLKMIAIVTMLIDHIGVAVVENGILKKIRTTLLPGSFWACREETCGTRLTWCLEPLEELHFLFFAFCW